MIRNLKFTSVASLSLLALTLGGFLALPNDAKAAVRCEIQYGGREVCVRTGKLQINKLVWNPSTKDAGWKDNMSPIQSQTNRVFKVGDTVKFRLDVKNVGDAIFSRVNVTDMLPAKFQLVTGALSYEITNLEVGKTDSREFTVKVISKNDANSCPVNIAEAVSGDDRDRDMSQVCLEGAKPAELKVLPKAGASNFGSMLLASIITGTLGLFLMKTKK